jgi:hypothetical protein
MTPEIIRAVLAWSSVINLAILLIWFLFFVLAHNWIYRMHKRWFNLSPDVFDALHYGGMGLYKLGILLFNLVPYLVLRIMVCP